MHSVNHRANDGGWTLDGGSMVIGPLLIMKDTGI